MSTNCKIYETFANVKEMRVEKSSDGLMTLSGTFGVCGVRNNNKRVYETGNYKARVKELQALIEQDGGIPGELEHPDSMNITLENVSHKITKIDIDENGVVSGEIQLLNTPKGKTAQAIVEGGLPLYVSSRATGQVGKDGMVTLETLRTYDLVGSPGFSQARMHLNESYEEYSKNLVIISEKDENNKDNNMTENAILERIEALESQIQQLREENNQLRESQGFDIKMFADKVQEWAINELAPNIAGWVTEEFKPELIKENQRYIKGVVCEKLAPAIQQWVVDEYTPEVEKWVTEHYSPEVEKWITEHYSPEVEKWITEEVAPAIQSWMIKEYSPEVENWVQENYSKKVENMISEHVKGNSETTRENTLKDISDTLALLEGLQVSKPSFGAGMVNEAQVVNEPFYIQNMPEQYRPQYNMASQEVKEHIARRAKITDFTSEGAIERFWSKIDFNMQPAKPVTEGLEKYEDERERQIRAMFRRNRRF